MAYIINITLNMEEGEGLVCIVVETAHTAVQFDLFLLDPLDRSLANQISVLVPTSSELRYHKDSAEEHAQCLFVPRGGSGRRGGLVLLASWLFACSD